MSYAPYFNRETLALDVLEFEEEDLEFIDKQKIAFIPKDFDLEDAVNIEKFDNRRDADDFCLKLINMSVFFRAYHVMN